MPMGFSSMADSYRIPGAKDAGQEGKRLHESFMDQLDATSQKAVENPGQPIARPKKQVARFWGGGIPK